MSDKDIKRKGLSYKWNATMKELKRIQWPNKKQLVTYTISVIFVVIAFSLAFYLIDSLLGFLVTKIVSM